MKDLPDEKLERMKRRLRHRPDLRSDVKQTINARANAAERINTPNARPPGVNRKKNTARKWCNE